MSKLLVTLMENSFWDLEDESLKINPQVVAQWILKLNAYTLVLCLDWRGAWALRGDTQTYSELWDAELCECVNDAVTCQGNWNQMKLNEGKELYYMILSWKGITFEVLLIIISIRILSLWRCFQTFSLMYKDWYLNKHVFHVKPPLEIHFTQLKRWLSSNVS